MPIPESQLETWSHQGSVTQSSSTYATIKRSLEAADAKYAGKAYEIFLQGSYGNDTNIYAESDVDVVIRFDSLYYYDLNLLPPEEKAAYEATLTGTTESHAEFKTQVVSALQKSFGQAVDPGQKAIKIKPEGARRSADVVVATQFRRYRKYTSVEQRYDLGICFFTAAGSRVANYPRQHSKNCTTKHQSTKEWFKPMVRILKNMRGKLVDDGKIADGTAPSYFLEGLLYNVPNENFGKSYGDSFVSPLRYLLKADRSKFVCVNEQYYLLGDSSVTWQKADCDGFLDAVTKLWNEWS